MKTNEQSTLAHEKIARLAYHLWERDGCPSGRDQDHWLEAERQLRDGAVEKITRIRRKMADAPPVPAMRPRSAGIKREAAVA